MYICRKGEAVEGRIWEAADYSLQWKSSTCGSIRPMQAVELVRGFPMFGEKKGNVKQHARQAPPPMKYEPESDLQPLQMLPSSTISSLLGVQFIIYLGHSALTLVHSHLDPCDSIAGATL